MTRRMQANPCYFTGRHSVEHDEGFGCKANSFTSPAGCQPVLAPRRMQANAEHHASHPGRPDGPSGHVHCEEHDETAGCDNGTPCTPVAPKPEVTIDGVSVGDDATVVRHECTDYCGCDTAPGTVRYTVTVPPPKPTFFEAGKKYIRSFPDGTKWTYRVTQVETDGQGVKVAFGERIAYYSNGVTRRTWDRDKESFSRFANWTETTQ